MTTDYWTWLLAITSFAVIMTFTPGPNNIMLATSGANFGIKKSMPHVLGVAIGFPVMLLIVGGGLGFVFQFPLVRIVLRVVGVTYILYLAYLIATASNVERRKSSSPLSFWQAASFQWVNPKAWAQAVGASSAYLSMDYDKATQIIAMAAVFFPIGIASSYIWAVFGTQLARLLNSNKKLKIFNRLMACSLVATVLPVILTY